MCHNTNININRIISPRLPFPGPGCIGPRPWQPCPGPTPWNPNPWGRDHHRNLPDQNVGPGWRRGPWGLRFPRRDNGYVIDLNNNGRYDKGRDGVLVFDMNRDGKYDKRDVSNTNDLMKAAAGNYDFDNDGRVSCCERRRGAFLRCKFAQLDTNRNGRLEAHEIARAGGKVWIDKSKGGGISRDELHSPYNLPGRWFGDGSRRLDYVDPHWGSGTSRNFPRFNFPVCRPPHIGISYPSRPLPYRPVLFGSAQ